MKVFYNDLYTASPEEFETTRKSQQVASDIKDRVEITDPSSVADKADAEFSALATHDFGYIDALRTGEPRYLAMSSGFEWGKTTYDFALSHAHGCVASIQTLMNGDTRTGTLSSGLHHASPSSGAGFCTLNGLAVGAHYAMKRGRSVMIIDFDAHCGGGTYAHIQNLKKIFNNNSRIVQIDMSVSGFDHYSPSDEHYLDLHIADDDEDYIDHIITALAEADKHYEDGMIIMYNAGVDPVNTVDFHDPFDVIQRREELVSAWIGNKPAMFTLAGGYKWGGYTEKDISKLHQLNIDIWARESAKVGVA